MTLEETIHDKYMSWGAIEANAELAPFIMEWEKSNGVELTKQEIMRAIYHAGERFADSMQDDASEEEAARFEAMRPSVRRKKEILAMLG